MNQDVTRRETEAASTPLLRKELLGKGMVALGVAVWIPYLAAVFSESHPPIAPFLALHLTLVLGGVRVKRTGSGGIPPRRGARYRVGTMLVVAGVLVWAPYLYNKYILHDPLVITPFLVSHLSGVVLGGFLRLSDGSKEKSNLGIANERND
ncbi:MAG: hypothetical protein HYZ26_13865 [Chloroflexi bacterium]|nr:hypothetical protein [Chloroflexota bacterium]